MKQQWPHLHNYLLPNEFITRETGLFPAQASVMILLTNNEEDPEIIFTLRARHLTNHPGEVSFPGGMWEPDDTTLLHTALRETHEEIGLCPSAVTVLGACTPRSTRAGVRVTPFVGMIDADIPLIPNLDELDAVFHVSLSTFRSGIQTCTDVFTHLGKTYHVPVYQFQRYKIWGFTAALTCEIVSALNSVSDQKQSLL